MESILDASMGEYVSPEIWQDVRRQIIYRSVIRRNVNLRVTLTRHPDLGNRHAVLGVEFEYELHGLTAEKAKMTVKHELDYQFTDKQRSLPRFERALVEDEEGIAEYEGPPSRCFKDGILTLNVKLEARDGKPARILTERLELTNTRAHIIFT
jgi:hypothetical protein